MNEQQQPNALTVPASRTAAVSMAAGGLVLTSLADVGEFAKMMAGSGVAVPKHLRGSPGACVSVILQALEWRMSPFSVANKSYSVNDRLAYEAQLIAAVILQRAPIRGRPKYVYKGQTDSLQCTVSVRTTDDETVDYTSPRIRDIAVKNSPLWKSDPEQQLGYYSIRALARRHFPDVILGVYADDEVPREAPPPRDITPTKQPVTIAGKLDRIAERKQPVEEGAPGEARGEPGLSPAELAALAEFAEPEETIEEDPEEPKGAPTAPTAAQVKAMFAAKDAAGHPTGETVDQETGEIEDDDSIGVSDPEEVFGEPPKPDPKQVYLDAVKAVMRTADSAENLAKWWSMPKQREQRRLWLTVDEANDLKVRVTERVQQLKQRSSE